jgi:ApaG protein
MTKPIAKKIQIRVKTAFSELQSNVDMHEFFFTYHITILNESESVVQLMSRKWFITDSNGENRFVEGEGVVGEQPLIQPGSEYSYYSGCLLKTGFGKMSGSYAFLTHPLGMAFEVPIPEFNLVLPWVLN